MKRSALTARTALGLALVAVATAAPAADFGPYAGACSTLAIEQIGSTVPANVLWPEDKVTITCQVLNKTDKPYTAKGVAYLTRYAIVTYDPDDMFATKPEVYEDLATIPVEVNVPANGYQNLEITPPVPERFGGYLMTVEFPGINYTREWELASSGGPTRLGENSRKQSVKGTRLFVSTMVRAVKNPPLGDKYIFTLDTDDINILTRVGSTCNRIGMWFRSPGDEGYEQYYQQQAKRVDAFKVAKLPLVIEFGHDALSTAGKQPLGMPRNFLTYQDGKPMNLGTYPGDCAWLPKFDPDFKVWVKRLALEFGAPKGPIVAMRLWNEPWNGASIACWGADDQRYREIFTMICEAVEEARKEGGVKILLSGCDSSSNTLDKLFCNEADRSFLPRMDAMSEHYQGLHSAASIKMFVDRKSPYGRVQIWDTESWVANSDDRMAGSLSTYRAAGYDRTVGVLGGAVGLSYTATYNTTPQDKFFGWMPQQAVSGAASFAAVAHFLSYREFDRILFDGLPYVYLFKGLPDATGAPDPDDGTIVVTGDITAFMQANVPLFCRVRGAEDVKAKQALFKSLATLPVGSEERTKAQTAWNKRGQLSGVSMRIKADGDTYGLYDFYGNPVPAEKGTITIPIDNHGYFLRANGKPGSFAALLKAMQASQVTGLEPVEIQAHDMQAPIAAKPALVVDMHNMLNRPVTAKLTMTLGALKLDYPASVELKPYERQTITATIAGGQAAADNNYPLTICLDAGGEGQALHSEVMHCNVIAHRTIAVDGKLDDWKGVLPQMIMGDGTISRTTEEAAWWPDKSFSKDNKKGLATVYLAYDEKNLYFAAKVADEKLDAGTPRYATRDDDAYFYPQVTYRIDPEAKKIDPETKKMTEHQWPEGVRRYSYATWPDLPGGGGRDNIQIGFNVLPPDQKAWYPDLPNRLPNFIRVLTTDYEYVLNRVAAKHGGGTEIFRLQYPGMVQKHFYPREPKGPYDGPAKGGNLVVTWEDGTRLTECALPWSEIPEVKKAIDAGRPVKFTCKINDDADIGCMELARYRSVSRQNNNTFRNTWEEHWENTIDFGVEKN